MAVEHRIRRRRVRPLLIALVALALVGGTWHAQRVLTSDDQTPVAQQGREQSARSPQASELASPGGAPGLSPEVEELADDREKALGKLALKAEKLNQVAADEPVTEFVVATYNVLGTSHKRRGFASGGNRMARAIGLIRQRGIDVIGLQELQPNQHAIFRRNAPEYQLYTPPGGRFRDDSVAFRRSRFELVEGGSVAYPYFGGRPRPYPQILLREKRTGVQFYVTSYHNPAYEGGTRARVVGMQIANANALIERTKRPLIITGDMNDRRSYVCPMVTRTPMRPAQGGGCGADARAVDWVMGSAPSVSFSRFFLDWSTEHRKLSDHPLVLATATVTGLKSDRHDAEDPWSKSPSQGE